MRKRHGTGPAPREALRRDGGLRRRAAKWKEAQVVVQLVRENSRGTFEGLTDADSYYCFMDDFRDWVVSKGRAFPVTPVEDFVPQLLAWRTADDAHTDVSAVSCDGRCDGQCDAVKTWVMAVLAALL